MFVETPETLEQSSNLAATPVLQACPHQVGGHTQHCNGELARTGDRSMTSYEQKDSTREGSVYLEHCVGGTNVCVQMCLLRMAQGQGHQS